MFRIPFIATLQTFRTRAGLAALVISVALMAAAFFSLSSRASTATVATDQASYATGDMVIITGSGWVPGERVALEFAESLQLHPAADTLYAVADSAGTIYQEYIIPDHGAGQTFTLTATGEVSGSAGPTTFTIGGSSASPSSSTPASSMTATGPATVTTDKGDYAPGETVYITGSGWEPRETVKLVFEELRKERKGVRS